MYVLNLLFLEVHYKYAYSDKAYQGKVDNSISVMIKGKKEVLIGIMNRKPSSNPHLTYH